MKRWTDEDRVPERWHDGKRDPLKQLVLRSARRPDASSLVPTEHPQRPERVPPARLARRFAARKGERLIVRPIEKPSTVGLSPALNKMHGIAHPRVGLDIGAPEVVERPENVVMVAGRERELQERRIRDLAGGVPSEKATLEQVLLAAASGRRDLRRRPDGTLVLDKPLQHADGGVERRARTLRCCAVPTAVVELLADETARQTLRRAPEVGAKREHPPVDARLQFPLEEPVPSEFRPTQLPEGLIVPPQARLEARHRRINRRFGAVGAGRAQEQQCEKGRQPDTAIASVPRAVRLLAGENFGPEALARDAGAFGCNRSRRGIRQIAHRLPADGGVRIEQPVAGVHAAILALKRMSGGRSTFIRSEGSR